MKGLFVFSAYGQIFQYGFLCSCRVALEQLTLGRKWALCIETLGLVAETQGGMSAQDTCHRHYHISYQNILLVSIITDGIPSLRFMNRGFLTKTGC